MNIDDVITLTEIDRSLERAAALLEEKISKEILARIVAILSTKEADL